MKIQGINFFALNFTGQRQDRKTAAQLKGNNNLDLNLPNQRRILAAIGNLGQIPGKENIKFLLDIQQNLKYGTKLYSNKKPYHDWNKELTKAIQSAYELSSPEEQKKIKKLIKSSHSKNLTRDEILIKQRKRELLRTIDQNSLKDVQNSNVKNVKRNLEYFIVSSEVPTSQKLYILNRLVYFMSPNYKINPQLAKRKTQALAEIINDIVVNTPESKIPNSKAINQEQHGICAAISICRKNLAYEDKPNYVDMVLSELDDKDYLMVYDINDLGSGKKIPLKKTLIDFNYALDKGYRIVDTSAMYWMNIADTYGAMNESVGVYLPFDKENFDTFADSHMNKTLQGELSDKHDFYRALLKAKSSIKGYKKQMVKKKFLSTNKTSQSKNDILKQKLYHEQLREELSQIAPNKSIKDIRELANELISLEIATSQKTKNIHPLKKTFVYLPNEEEQNKIVKIKGYLKYRLPERTIDDKQANSLMNLITDINDYNKSNGSNIGQQINKMRDLYQAAAAYRIQQVYQLNIPQCVNNEAIILNIPDNETILLNTIDKLLKQAESGELKPAIKEALLKRFGISAENENDLIDALTQAKETVSVVMSNIMDDLYHYTLQGDRKQALNGEIGIIAQEVLNNNKPIIENIAQNIGVKPNKYAVAQKLSEFAAKLNDKNCTDKDFIYIYNKLGHKSQLLDFKEHFENLGKILFSNKNEEVLKNFNKINGLPEDAAIELSLETFNKIAENFNNISAAISAYHNMFYIEDDKGNIINSTRTKDIILKKLENYGEVPKAKDLEILQQKLNKISKLRYEGDEGKTYKELPKELTKITPYEKELLRDYESKINVWYSVVSKRLQDVYLDIKEPLDELHRGIGVKTGSNWVMAEGSSGLTSKQEVKIIEHMTGRPYYREEDIRKALNKIKNGPYSGISSTSVSHLSPGMHAQYLADVRSVRVRNNEHFEEKDALFHDNTWGGVEHENTWTDSSGLLRTDYGSMYGGYLGYITDERYLNGNIVDNVVDRFGEVKSENIPSRKYKKLSPGGSYKFPLINDIIVAGEPNTKDSVLSLRENIIYSPYAFLPYLKDYAQNMTTSELKAAMNKVESVANDAIDNYNNYLTIIKGKENDPFNRGITNKAEYDNLPSNNPTKILLEKIALQQSYPDMVSLKEFYKEFDKNDLKKYEQKIKDYARNNFDYTFAKNRDIINYLSTNSRTYIYDILQDFESMYNIKISDEKKAKILNNMKKINSKSFDGSLSNTIDLMSKRFVKSLNNYTPDFENKQDIIDDLGQKLAHNLKKNSKLTIRNIDSFSYGKLKNIADWIDEVFSPKTDEEFIRIFNSLRNMTTKEFKAKYDSKITNKALGIRDITGYDIISGIRNDKDSYLNSLWGTVYYQEYSKGMNLSKTTPSYDYSKFSRSINGYRYTENRTFDDIYIDYYYSLRTLTYPDEYKKLSHWAFNKYEVFPAYPDISIVSENGVQSLLNKLESNIEHETNKIKISKIQQETFRILKKIQNRLNKSQTNTLPETWEDLTRQDLRKFLILNLQDQTIKDIIENTKKILSEETHPISVYKNHIDKIYKEISFYELNDGKDLNESIKESLQNIEQIKKEYIQCTIQPKYQSKAFELLNKYISAKIKEIEYNYDNTGKVKEPENADEFYEKFSDFAKKHLIIKSPQNILNEYLLINAKDYKPTYSSPAKEDPNNQTRRLERLNETYEQSLKGALFGANMYKIQSTLMDCTDEGQLNKVTKAFKNSTLQLNDGSTVRLDSDDALKILILQLTRNKDIDTAIMFLEQLGLTERFVEMVSNTIDFEDAKKVAKRINSIASSVDKQIRIFDKELEVLENIDEDPDYEKTIQTVQNNIVRKMKRTNFRRTIPIFVAALNSAIKDIKLHPQSSRKSILEYQIGMAKGGVRYVMQTSVENENSSLELYDIVDNLMRNITLPDDSTANDLQKKYFEAMQDYIDYRASISKEYKNIGLTTM